MRLLIKAFLLLLIIQFFSCNSTVTHEDCKEIIKIEVFTLGYPHTNFPTAQREKDVRRGRVGFITKRERLEKVKDLIEQLNNCEDENRELGSIRGVCDFYCKNGGKYTLLYDSFTMKIDEDLYCNVEELVNELFEKEVDKSD